MSEPFERRDGRRPEEKRPVSIETDFVRTAYGSCLIATGNTRVICTASVEEAVPPFLKGKGQGWVTAEYAMLPASTTERKKRDGIKKDGRSVEIQRLIGRSLRQAVDLKALGERTITLDCDVLEADGGTRTASITGAMVALTCAVDRMIREKKLLISPIVHQVAAVSAGIVDNTPCLDLCYTEDSSAQVDMNFVMNESREFIELQGTGEGRAFSSEELATLMSYGMKGVSELMQAQREALGDRARHIAPKPLLLAATGNEHKLRRERVHLRRQRRHQGGGGVRRHRIPGDRGRQRPVCGRAGRGTRRAVRPVRGRARGRRSQQRPAAAPDGGQGGPAGPVHVRPGPEVPGEGTDYRRGQLPGDHPVQTAGDRRLRIRSAVPV